MQAPTPEQRKEIVRRGEAIYQEKLRAIEDTPENFGKILVVNVDTGDYAVDAHHLTALDCVRAKSAEGYLYSLRIGYPALSKLGGAWNLNRETK